MIVVDTTRAPAAVRYTLTDRFDGAQLASTGVRLRAAGHLTAATRLLVDIRGLHVVPSLLDLVHTMREAAARGPLPSAIGLLIPSGPRAFDHARQVMAVLPAAVQGTVMTDESAALAWLDLPRP